MSGNWIVMAAMAGALLAGVALPAPALAQAPNNVPGAGNAPAANKPAGEKKGPGATGALGGFSKNSGKPIDILSDTLTIYDEKKLAVFRGNVRAKQGSSTLTATQLDVHYTGGQNVLTGQAGQKPSESPSGAQGQPVAQAPQAGQTQPAGPTSSAAAAAKPASQIKKIVAVGNVVINSEDNQTTKCDRLVYDVATKKINVQGNLVINSEEDQTTTGDWAIYDVAARKAVVGGNVVLSQGENVLKGDRLNIDLATGESRFANTGTTPDGSRRIRALLLPKKEDGKAGKKKRKRGQVELP